MGSIGIGFAGGFGVLVLTLVFGLKPGSFPVDVILIIVSVIAAIAAMQVAGCLDYLVYLAEKILRSNPKYITFYAPVVTYVMTIMLAVATVITMVCRIDSVKVLDAATFKSGMSACVCVLGVAWLGTTFVTANMEEFNVFAGDILESKPWLLALVLFFASMLLYSQAATTKTLMPAALELGVSPVAAIASFAAADALFVLPTYPTLLAAVEFDDTGSTRIGKYVFDHPFIIPGVLTITLSVILAFITGPLVI